jgi:hypothetical protein
MTSHKHLKARVRARMSKTGERYASARRHTVPSSPATATVRGSAKQNPASSALRLLLEQAGVVAPHTGQPFTEAMVFGIGGGIGAGVFAFHYAKDDFSSFFIAGRHLWQDDVAWLKRAAARLGAALEIRETTSAKAAAKDLLSLTDGRPAMAWVDMGSLPYRGMPAHWCGMGQHLAVVRRIDEPGGTAELDDLARSPIAIDLKAFAAARARVKTQKHRIAALQPDSQPRDLRAMVKEGLGACAQGLVTQRLQNFTLTAFHVWADRLHGDATKDGWERMFPPGPNLWRGLTSIYQFTEHWGGHSLLRGIFAEFLREAGDALDSAPLMSLADRYAGLARGWSAIAAAALPDDVPPAREARHLYDRISITFRERGSSATAQLTADWNRLEDLAQAKAFPMTAERSDALRSDLKQRVLAIHGEEAAAREEMVAAAALL